MTGFCRDCLAAVLDGPARCPCCASPRLIRHAELDRLGIAHIDCDAFYAAIEKRDNPALVDKPVIVGGGKRGVVATACYIARTFGIRSAMPMFEALALCPSAIVVRPDMAKYVSAGKEIRALMLELTPLVEPLSIDEAFLDLAGTHRLHGEAPAVSLARFARRVEATVGITVSIGLAPNKFLAKIASDLDKPRGFSVIGQGEALAFLAPKPVSAIFGVGKIAQVRLARDGYRIIADLQQAPEADLVARYGSEGARLFRLSRGIDARPVRPDHETKSVSAETTLDRDLSDFHALERLLWQLCERVSARLKAKELAGSTVTLKLKTSDFKIRTRARALVNATELAHVIFGAGRDLLRRETGGTRFRLIGIGLSSLTAAGGDDRHDLIDTAGKRNADAERAVDRIRKKFGGAAIVKGLALESDEGPG